MARLARKKQRLPDTPEALLERALRRLGSQDGKQALDLLRRAQFKGASPGRIAPLFHRAYSLRAEELQARGYLEQAEALRETAARYSSGSDKVRPSEEDLLSWLRGLDDEACFREYATHLHSNGPHPEAEVVLADRIMLQRCGEHLTKLDPESQFHRDATTVLAALDSMDRAEWRRAHELMRPISRASAFRDWRVFCAAMEAYSDGDGEALGRVLSLLPADFPLPSTVKALRCAVAPAQASTASASGPVAELLGVQRGMAPMLGRALRQAIQKKLPVRIAKALSDLARAMDPQNLPDMQLELLRALDLAVEKGSLDGDSYWRVVRRLVREGRREMHMLHCAVQALWMDPPKLDDVGLIADFLFRIESEFPDPDMQRLARSSVLERLAQGIRATDWRDLDDDDFAGLAEILEPLSSGFAASSGGSPLSLDADLLRLSLHYDPANRKAHKRLIAILRGSLFPNKSEILRAYEDYAQAFPEDPEPWIALAELRLRDNAYRKADAALKNAVRYAGQNPRVLELRALTLIRAAQNNVRNTKLDLAARDLSVAEGCGTAKTEPLLRAWRALLAFARRGHRDIRASFENEIGPLPASIRAHTLVLALDACSGPDARFALKRSARRELAGMVRAEIGEACREDAAGLARLVAPLPEVYECVTSPMAVCDAIDDSWEDVLRAMPQRALFEAFGLAVQRDAWPEVRREAARRLQSARDLEARRKLLLYLATVRYLLREDDGARRFQHLKGSIPAEEQQPIRVAAAQLGRVLQAHHPLALSDALRAFDFDRLDEPRGLF